MYATIALIAITVLTTLAAFNDVSLLNKLILFPFGMREPKDYYRMLTSGFIHADFNHLIFNMITLYFFGQNAQYILGGVTGSQATGSVLFVVLYLSAIIISAIPGFTKHKNHSYHRELGASGGVSAILFFTIYYFPWSKVEFMFIPFGIPAILFAIAYTAYSIYMSKRGADNIAHDAHLGGAAYGFVFAFLVDPTHGRLFLHELLNPRF